MIQSQNYTMSSAFLVKRFDLNRAEQMWEAAHSPQNVTNSDVAAMIDSQYSCFDEDTYEKITCADAMRGVALARERSFESAVPVGIPQSESASMSEGVSQFEAASEVQWREFNDDPEHYANVVALIEKENIN